MVGIKLFRIESMRFYKLYLILTICTVLFLGNTAICNAELYDWTEWSAWQDSSVSENDDRQVETRKVVESYAVESWVYTDYSSNSKRGYWPHSTANALRAHYTETWPKEWIDNARWVIAANTYYDSPDNDNCDGMVHDQTAYVCVHGQGHDYVPFFIVGTNYKTQYRYREKVYLESDIEKASIDSKTDAGTLTISDNGRPLDENIRVMLNNRVLTKDVDYTVSYDASIETGPVNVKVTGIGDYTGSVTVKCTKVPKRTVVRTITVENNQIIVYWDESDDADGVEIEYSLNSDFSSSVSKDCKKGSTTTSISGIRQSGTYYVRVRTYRTRSKVRYYSAWSNTNTVYLVIENNNFDLSKAYINPIPDKKYTGKAITPVPTIMNGTYELAKDVDYTVEYRNNKKVGTATVIMTGKGDYYGTVETTFKIIPKGTSIKKATKKTKSITIRWKKNSNCSGYQIKYSTHSNLSNSKTKTITTKKKTKLTLTGLSSGTTYYIQIRTFKATAGEKLYSKWSKKKVVKTKAINTKKRVQYSCIKIGKYLYCGVGNKIVRVNLKNKRKKTIATVNYPYSDSGNLCIKNGYLYFFSYDGEDYSYGSLTRVKLNGKNKQTIWSDIETEETKLMSYYFSGNRVYLMGEDMDGLFVYSTALDGSDLREVYMGTNWNKWQKYNGHIKSKKSNKKGYYLYVKLVDKKSERCEEWLKTPKWRLKLRNI